MAARLDVRWERDGTVVVQGDGFAPNERLIFTLTSRSGGGSVASGPGTLMQSSGNSVQSSSTTLQSDARGSFQWRSTVIASGEAEVTVSVRGDRGNRAEARVSGTGRR